MIKSSRTKRRKVRAELNLITNVNNHFQQHCAIEHQISNSINIPNLNTVDNASLEQNIRNPNVSHTLIDLQNNVEDNEQFEIPFSLNLPEKSFFLENLTKWAVNYNISLNACDGLLSVLRQHNCFANIPKDSRTLLGTPRKLNLNIRTIEPGIYYHFGLANGIIRNSQSMKTDINSVIKIAVGIDGLPISKSTNSQLWPILGFIMNTELKPNVFIIGIFHGHSKPKNSDDFLHDFVTEACNLLDNGIVIAGKKISIHINAICCDAPAKSFVLKVKSPTAFHSCTRCIIEGEYLNNRVCFTYTNTGSALRTDTDYRNFKYEDHHTSLTPSIVMKLQNFNITNSFIIDYMHLTNLGVMKKLLSLWLTKGPLRVRVPGRKITEMSNSLLKIKKYIPSDFCRKPREIQDYRRFKATELQFLLIYSGPLVFKHIISTECYSNFMSLNVAMTIILSSDYSNFSNYAQKLLEYFVETFDNIYGSCYVSYNIHGLLHIVSDFERYGPLDNISCYPFENFMKKLKSMIRKHEKPLQQIIHRYQEQCNSEVLNNHNISTTNNTEQLFHYSLKNPHSNRPLLESITGKQYLTLTINNFTLNVKFNRNSFFLTANEEVVKCFNIILNQNNVHNNIYIVGKRYLSKLSAYKEPIDSKILNIYLVDKMSKEYQTWSVKDVKKKMMVIHFNHKMFAMPVLHSET